MARSLPSRPPMARDSLERSARRSPARVCRRLFRARLGDVREAADETVLQSEPWKFSEDRVDFLRGKLVILNADRIQRDAGGAQSDFGLLVESNRRRRVERDAVPDQPRAPLVDAGFGCEEHREVGAFDLEPARP